MSSCSECGTFTIKTRYCSRHKKKVQPNGFCAQFTIGQSESEGEESLS